MSATLSRAFRQPAAPTSETPALIRRESWDDVGHITIGPVKSYGYRCYPGHGNCRRIVRLFCGNGFEEAAYDVCFFTDRPATCDCADAVYRRKDETGATCKHIRAVVALGLDKSDAERVEAIEAGAAALTKAVAAIVSPFAEVDAAVIEMDAMFARHLAEAD
jgi:hypothetical protein